MTRPTWAEVCEAEDDRRRRRRWRHRRTDPACINHRTPRGRLERWWYDRRRGYSCDRCMSMRRDNPDGWRMLLRSRYLRARAVGRIAPL